MPDLVPNLQETNQKLREILDSLICGDGSAALITPEHLTALLGALLAAGAFLRQVKRSEREPDLALAIREYRDLLEQLRNAMPSLHGRLLAERARLESERTHLEAATSWAESSRQTASYFK